MIAPHILTARPRMDLTRPALRLGVGSAHLVGICGSGMKALAELLLGLGWKVTGSDLRPMTPLHRKMRERGVRIHSGHDESFLPRDVDVVVHSPAVGPNNPELRMAVRLGIPQMSYSQMLGYLMQTRVGVAVAGTHGKSTTAAMTATILGGSRLSASAVFGAELCDTGASGWAGTGDILVTESCEYQRSFLDLRPRFAAILGIEPDHFDCYKSFADMKAAFAGFSECVEAGGAMLIRADCAASAEVVESTAAEVVTFSSAEGADWWATDERRGSAGVRFRIFFRGDFFAEISLRTRGRHNVLKALAAAALSHHAGATPQEIREGLAQFPGIRRRFEAVGWWRGVTLIDDYAHHPTEVRATLATAREEFPTRKIWCAFQPHQVSRTNALMSEFAESFSPADEILIAPVFAARESLQEEPITTAQELASRIAARGQAVRFCPSLDQIISTLEDESRPGDVLITMGAGDIDRVPHEFTRRLQRRHTA